MGLASKIKAKLTPDNVKSRDTRPAETNMHPNGSARGTSPNATSNASMNHNCTERSQLLRGRWPRDSGVEVGRDSRFKEHVDDDISISTTRRPRTLIRTRTAQSTISCLTKAVDPLLTLLVWTPLDDDSRSSRRHVLLPKRCSAVN